MTDDADRQPDAAAHDVAAEIAAHRACDCAHHVPGGPYATRFCQRCPDSWPCLVQRLAAERDAAHQHIQRIAELHQNASLAADALAAETAALHAALTQAIEAVAWLLQEDWPETTDPGPHMWPVGIRERLAEWRALVMGGEEP